VLSRSQARRASFFSIHRGVPYAEKTKREIAVVILSCPRDIRGWKRGTEHGIGSAYSTRFHCLPLFRGEERRNAGPREW